MAASSVRMVEATACQSVNQATPRSDDRSKTSMNAAPPSADRPVMRIVASG